MYNPIKWCWRIINIMVHRYLICIIAGFVLSHKFVFNDPSQLLEWRLYCALTALFAIAVFIGKNGVAYSTAVCIGFLIDATYYGSVHSFQYIDNVCFPNNYRLIWASLMIFPFFLLNNFYSFVKEIITKSRSKLFSRREEVLDRINSYLNDHSVIGIDSPYGNGKSTIVEVLKQKRTNWAFVTIGILSTTVDNIEFCIIREIDRVLESYGIFSNPLSKIKSIFSHDFVYCIGDLLLENQSYERQIENFVKDIRSLGKVIVLNFEDIDRITDVNHLNKIFSICDSLTKHESKFPTKYIKVIYQYNKNTLNNIFEKEYNDTHYIEKYIPHSEPIPKSASVIFKEILAENRSRYPYVEIDSFHFLETVVEISLPNQGFYSPIESLTVRLIEQILDSVNVEYKRYLERKKRDREHHTFEEAIIFNMVKIQFSHIYQMMKQDKNINEELIFFSDSEGHNRTSFRSLSGRIHKENDLYFRVSFSDVEFASSFFDESKNKNAEHNKDALFVICLLSYNFPRRPDYR